MINENVFEMLDKAEMLSSNSNNDELKCLLSEIKNVLRGKKEYIPIDSNSMYLVGYDIKEGIYKCYPKPTSGYSSCYVYVYKDALFNSKSELFHVYLEGCSYIELKDGVFVQLHESMIEFVSNNKDDSKAKREEIL